MYWLRKPYPLQHRHFKTITQGYMYLSYIGNTLWNKLPTALLSVYIGLPQNQFKLVFLYFTAAQPHIFKIISCAFCGLFQHCIAMKRLHQFFFFINFNGCHSNQNLTLYSYILIGRSSREECVKVTVYVAVKYN